ncbi:hypothetical protein GQ44DRAFT_23426 [Phaeosphaeriaceae sp. PMI808]|nr:hypothetical protein GQ44DRAFT_23426 [Phaeosphaeriaceae sp. PMI808]
MWHWLHSLGICCWLPISYCVCRRRGEEVTKSDCNLMCPSVALRLQGQLDHCQPEVPGKCPTPDVFSRAHHLNSSDYNHEGDDKLREDLTFNHGTGILHQVESMLG